MEPKAKNESQPKAPGNEDHLIRQPELLKLTSKSRSALYREINEGTFPAPVKIGKRAVAWRASEVYAWINDRPKTVCKRS